MPDADLTLIARYRTAIDAKYAALGGASSSSARPRRGVRRRRGPGPQLHGRAAVLERRHGRARGARPDPEPVPRRRRAGRLGFPTTDQVAVTGGQRRTSPRPASTGPRRPERISCRGPCWRSISRSAGPPGRGCRRPTSPWSRVGTTPTSPVDGASFGQPARVGTAWRAASSPSTRREGANGPRLPHHRRDRGDGWSGDVLRQGPDLLVVDRRRAPSSTARSSPVPRSRSGPP